LSEVTMLCDRIILIDEGKVIEEGRLEAMLGEFRREIVKVEALNIPARLPEGVYVHSVNGGHTSFTAETAEARVALNEMLASMGARIVERSEDAGSLEDYFVAKIGHKVT